MSRVQSARVGVIAWVARAACAASLLVGFGAAALLVRSFWIGDHVDVRVPVVPGQSVNVVSARTYAGVMSFEHTRRR